MRRFVFRAQAALDLRRRQEDEAKRALAVAEARAAEAARALQAERIRLDDMLQRAREEDGSSDLTGRLWYGNWIVARKQIIERCRLHLDECGRAVQEATQVAQLARRRARSLERFRDRAWRHYLREQTREEQKVLDELGAIRFARARPQAGGDT